MVVGDAVMVLGGADFMVMVEHGRRAEVVHYVRYGGVGASSLFTD
jgi:hypothetical protein